MALYYNQRTAEGAGIGCTGYRGETTEQGRGCRVLQTTRGNSESAASLASLAKTSFCSHRPQDYFEELLEFMSR